MIMLPCWTGLRISDGAMFDMSRVTRTWRLGPKILALGRSQRLEAVTDLWRRRINRVFDLAGPFRVWYSDAHVFGTPLCGFCFSAVFRPRDVADLIGDTEDMVLKHYARWVPERARSG